MDTPAAPPPCSARSAPTTTISRLTADAALYTGNVDGYGWGLLALVAPGGPSRATCTHPVEEARQHVLKRLANHGEVDGATAGHAAVPGRLQRLEAAALVCVLRIVTKIGNAAVELVAARSERATDYHKTVVTQIAKIIL